MAERRVVIRRGKSVRQLRVVGREEQKLSEDNPESDNEYVYHQYHDGTVERICLGNRREHSVSLAEQWRRGEAAMQQAVFDSIRADNEARLSMPKKKPHTYSRALLVVLGITLAVMVGATIYTSQWSLP